MGLNRYGESSPWMEIEIGREGADLGVHARGSREERLSPHRLGPSPDPLRFAAEVRTAALRGRPLGALLATAHELYSAVFREGVAQLMARLGEASRGEPLLLRLALTDPDLQAVPWEALCEPGSALGFLASSTKLLPARGVTTSEPWQPREIRGAVKVLAIAPQGESSLRGIEGALQARIASGEIEYLAPVVGAATAPALLLQRLREESPDIVHFVGHGSVRADGVSLIQVAGGDGDDAWLPVEILAQQLAPSFRTTLRLVVLEACEGAAPGAFASAAEILGRHGADAVIAHLWPVRADVARRCSEQLYGALVGRDRAHGDVARSLNEARRAILASFEGSAEAFSPVLYLRAPQPVSFDFRQRLPRTQPGAAKMGDRAWRRRGSLLLAATALSAAGWLALTSALPPKKAPPRPPPEIEEAPPGTDLGASATAGSDAGELPAICPTIVSARLLEIKPRSVAPLKASDAGANAAPCLIETIVDNRTQNVVPITRVAVDALGDGTHGGMQPLPSPGDWTEVTVNWHRVVATSKGRAKVEAWTKLRDETVRMEAFYRPAGSEGEALQILVPVQIDVAPHEVTRITLRISEEGAPEPVKVKSLAGWKEHWHETRVSLRVGSVVCWPSTPVEMPE